VVSAGINPGFSGLEITSGRSRGPDDSGRGRALTERTGRNKIFYAVYKKTKDQSKSVPDSTREVSINEKTRSS